MKEFDLINNYIKKLTSPEYVFNFNNDAAILPECSKNQDYVITKDVLVEEVHFFSNSQPETLAKKIIRTNLSDLSSMGSVPKFYFLAAGFPSHVSQKWIIKFIESLMIENKKFNITCLGGDTVSTKKHMFFSLTAIGVVNSGKTLKRSTASVGDDIYVSGEIGNSFIGLEILKNNIDCKANDLKKHFISHYEMPDVNISVGSSIVGVASSAIDISDGLIQDLGHIIKNSHLGAEIFIDKIPFSKFLDDLGLNNLEFKQNLIAAGDDYKLIFTAPAGNRNHIQEISKQINVEFYRIGKITQKKELNLFFNNKKINTPKHVGFEHKIGN